MTTIQELAIRDGRAGSGGAWRAESCSDGLGSLTGERTIWHYGTVMLRFRVQRPSTDCVWRWDGDETQVYTSTGHGSVSDQGGMNRLFRALGMPYYFSRAGGADIIER